MSLYRICTLTLESNIEFPELPVVAHAFADYQFRLAPVRRTLQGQFAWYHHWTYPTGETWLSFANYSDGYLLRFPGLADFVASAETVSCHPVADIPELSIRHLFLDQVFPLVLSRKEPIVLHASGVLTEHGAMGFVGLSGQGKSTLAVGFAQRGGSLLSDDFLVLRESAQGWSALPTYSGVRLWPRAIPQLFEATPEIAATAHYTEKLRIGAPEQIPFADAEAPIRSLYFLEVQPEAQTTGPSITPVPPQDALVRLIGSAFNIDITDKALLGRQFAAFGRFITCVPCFELRYERDFSALPGLIRIIADHQKTVVGSR